MADRRCIKGKTHRWRSMPQGRLLQVGWRRQKCIHCEATRILSAGKVVHDFVAGDNGR